MYPQFGWWDESFYINVLKRIETKECCFPLSSGLQRGARGTSCEPHEFVISSASKAVMAWDGTRRIESPNPNASSAVNCRKNLSHAPSDGTCSTTCFQLSSPYCQRAFWYCAHMCSPCCPMCPLRGITAHSNIAHKKASLPTRQGFQLFPFTLLADCCIQAFTSSTGLHVCCCSWNLTPNHLQSTAIIYQASSGTNGGGKFQQVIIGSIMR